MPNTGNNILIRPPVLNNADTNPQPTSGPSSAPPPNTTTIAELVTRLVTDTLQREGRAIINSIINPAVDPNYDIDQVITRNHADNLSEMDKIPDVVKSLREFSGQAVEFGSWRKSVERILTIYEPLKGTPKYYGILSVIRNKIIGQADIVLESYNTPLNWERISKCLTLHYADKRDLGTLEYQMTTLVQGNRSIPEFYQAVYHHLSLILNKLSSMEMGAESIRNLTQTYRDKALDTFIRGLKGDLSRLLSIKEPADLPQALHLCLKLQNVDFRAQHANHNNTSNRRYNVHPPSIPPKRYLQQPPQMIKKPFYPELYYNPMNQLHQPNYPQNPQRQYRNESAPLPPKPLPKPEPMDVDRSIQSRMINYQNRPRPQFISQAQKRMPPPNSQQAHALNKYQRIFNTEQHDNAGNDEQMDRYAAQMEQSDSNYDQTLAEYANNQDNHYGSTEISDDINFLD